MNDYCSPCMGYTNHMVHITQAEFEQLVCHDTPSIAKPEQTMISEDSAQAHRACMQYAFVAQIAERSMAVDDLNLLPNEDLS